MAKNGNICVKSQAEIQVFVNRSGTISIFSPSEFYVENPMCISISGDHVEALVKALRKARKEL